MTATTSAVPDPNSDPPRDLLSLAVPPAEVPLRARQVYEEVLRDSPRVREGNFSTIAAADLHILFDLYDEHFFGGSLARMLKAGQAPLRFDLSARLTRSAGLTKRFSPRKPRGTGLAPASRYEIVISTTLLFQTFQDVERTVRVNGIVCRDRLEALQRIFEHELLHLAEMLAWGKSSCSGDRFKALAWNVFAHTQTTHDLVTQHERARAKFSVRVGDRVVFEHEGTRHEGVLNRITRRATVLVESPAGQPYSNGKRYLKFYVPLPLLKKAE